MTIFEFVFALYSLLFGLALAQVFAGLGNTLQERHKIKIGWLTPLLGLFVTFDITSFWAIGWEMRGMFRPDFLYLLCGVLLAGIYYLAGRLVSPRDFVEWPDFDVYYFQHRRWVFGGTSFCNLSPALSCSGCALRQPFLSLASLAWPIWSPISFRWSRCSLFGNRRANIALLLILLVRYAIIPGS